LMKTILNLMQKEKAILGKAFTRALFLCCDDWLYCYH
jgi:hypothetical protein